MDWVVLCGMEHQAAPLRGKPTTQPIKCSAVVDGHLMVVLAEELSFLSFHSLSSTANQKERRKGKQFNLNEMKVELVDWLAFSL